MSANNFKATKNGNGSEFPICWTGQDDQGNHWGVSTSGIQASRLDTVSQGAEGDAQLIAALLDRHYKNIESATHKALELCVMFLTNVNTIDEERQAELVKRLRDAGRVDLADAVAVGGFASALGEEGN